MKNSRNPRILGVMVLLISTFLQPLVSRPVRANTANASARKVSRDQSVSDCAAADLDANIQFHYEPDSYFTIAFNFRNASGHACTLEPPDDLGIVISDPSKDNSPQGCTECKSVFRSTPNSSPALRILEDSEMAHVTYRWKTEPSSGGPVCRPLAWVHTSINHDYKNHYMLVAKNTLKNICSAVEISQFAAGMFAENKSAAALDDSAKPKLEIRRDVTPYYSKEGFSVRIDALEPPELMPTDKNDCPAMLMRTRYPDGMTRWDEVGGPKNTSCIVDSISEANGAEQVAMSIYTSWAEPGEHAVSVLQVLPSTEGAPETFSSNIIHYAIADGETVARDWGPQVKGLAVGANLDKNAYELGQDVPLHIAMENFSASVPILAASTIWHPCDVVVVEVRDERGNLLPKKYDDFVFPKHGEHFILFMCTGGGPQGLPRYPIGKIFTRETSLKQEHMLPAAPGNYTITINWPTFLGNNDPCEICQTPDDPEHKNPYAIAHTTVKFRILPSASAH